MSSKLENNFQIIDFIQKFKNKELSFEELSQEAKNTVLRVKKTSRYFMKNVEAQSEKIRVFCATDIANANFYISQYLHLLNQLLDDKSALDLDDIEKGIVETVASLNEVFLNYREKALIAMGPFRYPGINLIFGFIVKSEEYDKSIEELHYEIATQIKIETAFLSRLSTQENSQNFEDATISIATWHEEYLKILTEFSNLSSEELPEFKKEIEKLGKRHFALDIYNVASCSLKTDEVLPSVELLLTGSALLADEAMTSSEFGDILGILQHQLEEVEASLLPVSMSEDERDADIDNIAESLSLFHPIIAAYKEILLSSRPDFIDNLTKADAELKEAAERFRKAFADFQVTIDNENKILCVYCGHYNSSDSNFCEKCNKSVPKLFKQELNNHIFDMDEASSQTSQPVMTEKIHAIFMEAEKYLNGGDEGERLSQMLSEFKARLDSLIEISSSEQTINEAFKEAHNLFLEGYNYFMAFLETKDAEVLNSAKSNIWKALGLVQNIMI